MQFQYLIISGTKYKDFAQDIIQMNILHLKMQETNVYEVKIIS